MSNDSHNHDNDVNYSQQVDRGHLMEEEEMVKVMYTLTGNNCVHV